MHLAGTRSSILPHARSLTAARFTVRPDWLCAGLLLTACWLLVFNQQRLEWSVNPTYGYGWAVPVLALYLLIERWRQRPAATAPAGFPFWLAVPILALAFYLPVRVVQEANPDWVKANWALESVALALSFSALYALGRLRYVVWFAFPVLFCLTALPWPVWMEEYLVQALMRGNASVCAELLTLAGQPAVAQGNLIQVGHAWVNVEEACSGIRSLQTAFMVSLFFGEFFRLRLWGRAGLLLTSFGVAFILNLARTLVLTQLTNAGGKELAEKWHDTIGSVAMVLGLIALWGLAELFNRMSRQPVAPTARPAAPTSDARAPFPRWLAIAGVAWLAVCEFATTGWYRYHERLMPAPIAWDLKWPEKAPEFRRVPLAERTQALLKVSSGDAAGWHTANGQQWQAYYLRWEASRVSKFLSGAHYPTVCLPAGGLKLVAETGLFTCRVGDLTIPFRTYLFDNGGRDVYVFHAVIEDVPTADGAPVEYRQANTTERLRSVWRGERNLGQRVMGIAISGPLRAEEARSSLEAALRDLIHLTGPKAGSVAKLSTAKIP